MTSEKIYTSSLGYDDREAFFIDSVVDSMEGNPVMFRYNEQDEFDLDLNAYQIYDILRETWPDLKVRSEAGSQVTFWRHNPKKTNESLVFTFSVSSFMNKKGVLKEPKLKSVGIFIVCQFEKVQKILSIIEEKFGKYMTFEKERLETSWVQLQPNGSLSYRTMPIKETEIEIIPEAYPWIENPTDYINRYLKSSSPILILSGPPGTGKSTFIRHIINQAPKEFEIYSVYDEDIMKRDDLYTNFISNSKEAMLVIEDADRLLERRIEDQNTTMSKILNVSDGIIDLTMKKILFTTNIENINDVDQALIRPGRCFDILEFRNLSKDEARILADKIGKDLPIHRSPSMQYPISEIFNQKKAPQAQKFGFN